MWHILKSEIGRKGGGIKTVDTKYISRCEWEQHFSGLYHCSELSDRLPANLAPRGILVQELDSDFSADEICKVLEMKANHKAMGLDGYCVDALRLFHYEQSLTKFLAAVYNCVFAEAFIPEEWKRTFLFVLYKGKGDRTDVNSYRGITLKSHLLKLFETLLCNRIVNLCDSAGLFPLEQAAFHRSQSALEHIFCLQTIPSECEFMGKPLFAGFIHLSKAFPSVKRGKLIKKIQSLGFSDKICKMLFEMYRGDNFTVLLDDTEVDWFEVDIGCHEGLCLSPILFILFINDLPQFVLQQIDVTDTPTLVDGKQLGNQLGILLYADDIMTLAHSPATLQDMIDTVIRYCETNGLLVNASKFKILPFHNNPEIFDHEVWGIDDELNFAVS